MGLGGEGAIPCPAEETRLSTTPALLLKFFLRKIPIAGPQFQSAINVSCSYLQVLGSPTCPRKFLKTLVIHTLKRLASAVQLTKLLVAGFFSAHEPFNSSDRNIPCASSLADVMAWA